MFERFLKNLQTYGLEFFKLYYSEYDGVCTDNKDPQKSGRIQVKVPGLFGNDSLGAWAWPKMPWAGKASGMFMPPDVGDPVIVTFRNGDQAYPRYQGGWWPNVVDGDNYLFEDAYPDGENPTKRIFRTKAGHELSFDDQAENLSCKFVWVDNSDPDNPKNTFIAFTKDGNIQMANHKGCFMEFRAADDDELVMLADAAGNRFVQDKDGTKIADSNGNVVEMKDGVVQVTSTDSVVLSGKSAAMEVGGVTVGPSATAIEEAVKGTSFYAWLTTTLIPWCLAHTHPTGVGPSGPALPVPPLVIPTTIQILTKKLKMQ
jgi:hypothetical protein